MPASRQHRGAIVLIGTTLLAALGLVACSTPPATYEPPVKVPASFSASGKAALPDKWWLSLDDPVLDELIKQALSDNPGIRGAWDRLVQKRATAVKAGADLLPSLDATAGLSGQRKKTTSSGGAQQITSTTDLSLGLTSSYEIDLWGGIHSTRDAAKLDADATAEDLKTAAITLSAEVADTWYQLVEQYGQIDLLQSQIETNQQVLELVTLRFRRGQVQATDVLQQRQLVESKRGQMVLAESKARVLEHSLAVLLGKAPNDIEIPRINALVTPPPPPATGLPADLVQHRPDVRKAYFEVLAADRRTAAAVADRFPTLTLTAKVTTSGEYVRELFSNWLGSLAAGVVAPLFDAGARKAEVERTKAVTSEALNNYGQTVLTSLKEVEDALAQESHERDYLKSLDAQINLSDQALQRIRDTYINGGTDYVRVLDALLTNQGLESTRLAAQRQLIEYRINLCKALGGGWQMTPPAPLAKGAGPSSESQVTTAERQGG